MRHALLLIAALSVSSPALAADDWTRYSNPRFGYSAAVPPGFTLQQEADNGDGATFRADDGRSELSIYGTTVEGGEFAGEARKRIDRDRARGWTITYDKVTEGWASYSGSRTADVLYVRGIALCDGNAAYFRLRYPRDALKRFDGVIGRMVKSLRLATGCDRAPQKAPGAAPN
ncbi:hypothetical protein [Pararhizobium sp. LjRoot238]|uniref:hypothetical protein n=1 Tax=Pararhizobium sp. LjRoot238 TaxID=3342293 RepID=UPI003ECF1CB1